MFEQQARILHIQFIVSFQRRFQSLQTTVNDQCMVVCQGCLFDVVNGVAFVRRANGKIVAVFVGRFQKDVGERLCNANGVAPIDAGIVAWLRWRYNDTFQFARF